MPIKIVLSNIHPWEGQKIKRLIITNIGEMLRAWNYQWVPGGVQNGSATLEKSSVISDEVEHTLTLWSRNYI